MESEEVRTLDRAIAIATEAHAGQVKASEPYILHPIRVMMDLETPAERIVGILHDVVEKNPAWSLDVLRAQGFSETVVSAVDSVTRRDGENEETFIRRAAGNEIGRRVKQADLNDNLKLMRRKEPRADDREKMQKYQRANRILRELSPLSGSSTASSAD
jgi:(p)ppGpp synthase/HD superfamily hydrolase